MILQDTVTHAIHFILHNKLLPKFYQNSLVKKIFSISTTSSSRSFNQVSSTLGLKHIFLSNHIFFYETKPLLSYFSITKLYIIHQEKKKKLRLVYVRGLQASNFMGQANIYFKIMQFITMYYLSCQINQ